MNFEKEFEQENSVDLSVPANMGDKAKEGTLKEEFDPTINDRSYETSNRMNRTEDTGSNKDEPYNVQKFEKKSEGNFKKNVKGFTSLVAAGVVGSVLTLAVLPHTDYIKNLSNDNYNNQSVTASTENVTQAKPVSAQATTTASGSIADTVQRVSKAIVGIDNYQQQQQQDFFGNSTSSQSVETGSGSGVIFQKKDGYAYIVTNNHVVEGASKLEVSLYDGSKTTAELVGTDALTDLAVLKIPGKYVNTIATFGDSSSLRPGDQVYAIGNPLGSELSRTVTQGIVSATNRSISVSTSAGNYDTTVIQTDAAINPGNSGGALINPEGQVIGINSMKISESGVEGLGFAIPSDDVIPIVNQLITNGKIQRPYLGVSLADLNEVPQIYLQNLPSNLSNGVVVVSVDANSAAGRGGIQAKDVIVSMNGTSISDSAELRKFLYTKVKIGDDVKIGLYRNGKLQTVTVKLARNTNNSN
ncbi:trypsin-like peptidase domain-containing protein [Bacillus sp. BRMEA1]|uniref:S1C family serine protease n=1 Tax=Neobacillus endophyticus TaxID=2738405 RepID=UPI0015659383|nr:trypsin-like peptidase domain-containing protein [Neobacillus endophyticus]NRD80345.1 trypsin-like peptidase domain-containing protein [Neobacillus endophyticus]